MLMWEPDLRYPPYSIVRFLVEPHNRLCVLHDARNSGYETEESSIAVLF